MSTDETLEEQRAPTAGDQRGADGPRRILGILVAILWALTVVVAARWLLQWSNPLLLALLAYAIFVLAMGALGRANSRRRRSVRDGDAIDLAALERSEGLDPSAVVAPDVFAPPEAFIATGRPENTYGEPDATQLDFAPVGYAPADRRCAGHESTDGEWVDDPNDDQPRVRRAVRVDDLAEVGFALAAALAITFIQRSVTGSHGLLGATIVGYLAFVAVFMMLVRDRVDGEAALDRAVTVLVWSVAVLVIAVLAWMLVYLLSKGLPALRAGFFREDLSQVGPLTPGGGAKHAIIGTLEQVGLATLVVVPIAVLTAVYLHEIKGRLAGPARFIIDAMSGLPSIVAGLLVFTVWVNGRGFSGAAGAAALAVLMLPTVTRTSEEILRTIPDSLREASLALGAPQWRVVMRVVIPTARAGLVTAAILGVARAVGETAPVLLTAFGSDSTNWNPFNGPQSDLPLFVWKLIRVPNETQNARGWTGALVLVFLVLVLFVTARAVANRGQRKLGRGR